MAYRRLRSVKGYHWPGEWDTQGSDCFFLKLQLYSVHFLYIKCSFLFFLLYLHLKNSLSLTSSTYPTLITISLIDLHLLRTPLCHMFFKYSWKALLGIQMYKNRLRSERHPSLMMYGLETPVMTLEFPWSGKRNYLFFASSKPLEFSTGMCDVTYV